jgi:hypothetical protein
MNNNKSKESGQAIVLLVVSIVVLLGFTALAIDGGMVYSDRRKAKNAADTAALAGAAEVAARLQDSGVNYQNWVCGDETTPAPGTVYYIARQYAQIAARYRAETNGYSLDSTFGDNGVEIVCEDPGGSFSVKSVEVRTAVREETRTSFAQILNSALLENYVESATEVISPFGFGGGYALVALNEDPCQGNQNGLIIGGNSVVQIEGGTAFTNCCLNGNGVSITVSTEGNPQYYYDPDEASSCGLGAGSDASRLDDPTPASSTYTDEWLDLMTPPTAQECADAGSGTIDTENKKYNPGIYNDPISIPANHPSDPYPWTMEPGLYCLRSGGDAFTVNNNAKLEAIGVTLYLEIGGVKINGGATVKMAAPCTSLDRERLGLAEGEVCPDPSPAKPFILIYMDEDNSSDVFLSGTSETVLQGTIYHRNGTVEINGTNRTFTWETQVIAEDIHITGNPTLNVNFDGNQTFQFGLRLSNLE